MNKVSYNNLSFVLVTNTHLLEYESDLISDIQMLDKQQNVNAIIHLGGILNGDNPKGVSMQLLSDSLTRLSSSVSANQIYPCQGKNDGWRDERFLGQLVTDIITDEDYHAATAFIDDYPNLTRQENNPFYYVDVTPSVRLVFLCSYSYQIDEAVGLYQKQVNFGISQMRWLMQTVLPTSIGKTLYFFSNRLPNSVYETNSPYYVFEGNSTEPIIALLQRFQRKGVNIGAWIVGGYNQECIYNNCGITQVLLSSFPSWYKLDISKTGIGYEVGNLLTNTQVVSV